MAIMFENAGLIDLRSLTTFGINAKPASESPIGFFGTGLKYAIAVLIRTGHEVRILRGKERYLIVRDESKFRDKEFTFIKIQAEKGSHSTFTALPFTTELGKNWPLWGAFRELYSNVIDENGVVYVTADEDITGATGLTRIVVYGAEFEQIYHEKDAIFLPEAKEKPPGDVQIIDRPSNHIYYRGIRAFDLSKPSALTYNIQTEMELSEDRVLKQSYMIDYYVIKQLMNGSKDVGLITKALCVSKDNHYEGNLKFDHSSMSDYFQEAVAQADKLRVNVSAVAATAKMRIEMRSKGDKHPYLHTLLTALQQGDFDIVVEQIMENRSHFETLITEYTSKYDVIHY